MKNLKEYRDNELKWFLLANILIMIICSDVFSFGDTIDSWVTGISSILNVTVFSSAIYILTFVFDSVVPSKLKVKLVFWWKTQPSYSIFSDMERKFEDNRFTLDDAKKEYAKIYEIIKNKPKDYDQTPFWYEIYNCHRDNTIVFGSNRDYLLLRDMHAQTIMLLLAYILLSHMSDIITFSWVYFSYLVFMTLALNIAARVQGKRLMYNVLSIDINHKKLTKHSDLVEEKND